MTSVTGLTTNRQPRRAAVYPRVSSKQQEDNYSLDTQLAACIAHAERLGYVVEERHVFREVYTGVDYWERPQMTRLREAIRNGEIDAVVFYSVDRFARDPVFHMLGLAEARQFGVKFHIVTDDLDLSDDDDVLMFFLRGYAAKREWRDLAERTQRGRRARAAKGKPIIGPKNPYGLIWNEAEGRYLVNETEAAVLRRIIDEILGGASLRQIKNGLNADGIPSPSGKTWQTSTIKYLVSQQRYTGVGVAYQYKTTRKGDRWLRTEVPDGWEVPLPDGVYPQIITPDEFAAIQSRLAANRAQATRNNREPEAFLLRAGFIRCGLCGHVMAASSAGGRRRYRCATRDKVDPPCPQTVIEQHVIDNAVWERVVTVLKNPEIIARELARLQADDPTAQDLDIVERALKDVERQRDNLTRHLALFSNPEAAAPLVRQIEALGAQIAQLKQQREHILERRRGWETAQDRLADLESWCRQVAGRVDTLTYEQRRLALEALGVEVRVFPKGHDPRYCITLALPLEPPGLEPFAYSSTCTSCRCRTGTDRCGRSSPWRAAAAGRPRSAGL